MADLFHLVGFEPCDDAAVQRSDRLAAHNKARGVSGGAGKAALSRRQDAWRRSGQPDAVELGELTREDWEVRLCETCGCLYLWSPRARALSLSLC
jgi:hypothetical protein